MTLKKKIELIKPTNGDERGAGVGNGAYIQLVTCQRLLPFTIPKSESNKCHLQNLPGLCLRIYYFRKGVEILFGILSRNCFSFLKKLYFEIFSVPSRVGGRICEPLTWKFNIRIRAAVFFELTGFFAVLKGPLLSLLEWNLIIFYISLDFM